MKKLLTVSLAKFFRSSAKQNMSYVNRLLCLVMALLLLSSPTFSAQTMIGDRSPYEPYIPPVEPLINSSSNSTDTDIKRNLTFLDLVPIGIVEGIISYISAAYSTKYDAEIALRKSLRTSQNPDVSTSDPEEVEEETSEPSKNKPSQPYEPDLRDLVRRDASEPILGIGLAAPHVDIPCAQPVAQRVYRDVYDPNIIFRALDALYGTDDQQPRPLEQLAFAVENIVIGIADTVNFLRNVGTEEHPEYVIDYELMEHIHYYAPADLQDEVDEEGNIVRRGRTGRELMEDYGREMAPIYAEHAATRLRRGLIHANNEDATETTDVDIPEEDVDELAEHPVSTITNPDDKEGTVDEQDATKDTEEPEKDSFDIDEPYSNDTNNDTAETPEFPELQSPLPEINDEDLTEHNDRAQINEKVETDDTNFNKDVSITEDNDEEDLEISFTKPHVDNPIEDDDIPPPNNDETELGIITGTDQDDDGILEAPEFREDSENDDATRNSDGETGNDEKVSADDDDSLSKDFDEEANDEHSLPDELEAPLADDITPLGDEAGGLDDDDPDFADDFYSTIDDVPDTDYDLEDDEFDGVDY